MWKAHCRLFIIRVHQLCIHFMAENKRFSIRSFLMLRLIGKSITDSDMPQRGKVGHQPAFYNSKRQRVFEAMWFVNTWF